MSKPRYHWWSYAKAMIRLYPELKREYDAIHTPQTTHSIENVCGGRGCISRSTEICALRQLPPARQREYDAVSKAIELTKKRQNGDSRLTLIDMVYWKCSTNIAGAALRLFVDERTAKRYHGDFVRLVGFCYGLEDVETEE